MSPQRHREKDAKVEGRDQPEGAKETMGTFRALTSRLLKVTPEELAEREKLYEDERKRRHEVGTLSAPTTKKKKPSPIFSITKPARSHPPR
jgi:hypothetical protein